jgi:hypothetical protein
MDDERNAQNLNTDQLFKLMAADEAGDAPLITPVNYSKIRPIAAQLVYYAIRTHKLPTAICNCGRKCINKQDADNYYRKVRGRDAWPWGEGEDESDRSS